ncbi:HD domain-containing phosphohydrolase [Fusibacter sp. 3D3]|uniref:HD domain-containing phosphohydrolase n=1 Tax=Fusibacter sp. 3D3 TaxID=1048380 RepID=UPI000853DDCE|nr:HD domain-containing phosphohydrolase [Fusibacter sp. 3D3]GAU77078.1 response regulator [Fusibacter sp. 3D3]
MTHKIPPLEDHKFDLDFLSKDSKPIAHLKKTYKIIIADDDEDIHTLTELLLKDFVFEDEGLFFIHTYSADETIRNMDRHPDAAVILLDVVMEEMDSGLKVIDYIRKVQKNRLIRIVLRTGQPGYAPEENLIRDYDINDYKLKTELTKQKMYTTLYACLRSYRDLMHIERNKSSLEELVKISGDLFKKKSLIDFLESIFIQISIFQKYTLHLMPNSKIEKNGLIFTANGIILIGIGKFKIYETHLIDEIKGLIGIEDVLHELPETNKNVIYLKKGLLFYNKGISSLRDYVYIELDKERYDKALIELLINNYALALENYQLNELLVKSHEDVIFTLTETIERHSNETSNHVKRVSVFMKLLAKHYDVPESEWDLLRISSVLHDIGKIGIPDSILKKPGKLSYQEFEIIKTHTEIGYRILGTNNHPIFEKAADIAYYHHEKFDGTGYPLGLSGTNIPLYARMMAIIDVFDALVSKRCYKEAIPIDEVFKIMRSESGKHFDPILLGLFLNEKEAIIKVLEEYVD